jgi:hypothetical protein
MDCFVCLFERRNNIIDEICATLDTHRQANQILPDARNSKRVGANWRMRHGRRMTHQTFDAAERFGERKVSQILEKCTDCCFATVDLKTQHAAKSLLLPASNFVSRMAG